MRRDRRVARRFAGAHARQDRAHQRIGVQVDEQRDRIALRRGLQDAVRRRHVEVVGPAHQAVADVADEGTVQRRRVEPHAVAPLHLQAGHAVGREQRDVAVVGVRAGADLAAGTACAGTG